MAERNIKPDYVRVKTRTELLNSVADRWARQYPAERYPVDTDKGQIRIQLQGLKTWGRSVEKINSIIGNNSWTQQRCDRCDVDSDVILEIGDEPDYDMRWIEICPQCLGEMAATYGAQS